MNIALTNRTQRRIERQLTSGRYHSADEVVQNALELLERHQHDVQGIREKIASGAAELDRGEGIDGEEAFRNLLADLEDGGTP